MICSGCGIDFPSSRKGKKYCSHQCGGRTYRKDLGMVNSGLSTGNTGAMNELRVCADLLSKGYEVFRAVSPTCSCDLVVMKNGELFRVEVRTGHYNPKTAYVAVEKPKKGLCDVFAVALKSEIRYFTSNMNERVEP